MGEWSSEKDELVGDIDWLAVKWMKHNSLLVLLLINTNSAYCNQTEKMAEQQSCEN